MMWQYTRRELKLLLLATLVLFSAFSLLLAQEWRSIIARGQEALMANSVGVFAAVPQNEINTRVAELMAREQELDAREAALQRAQQQGTDTRTLLMVTLVGTGLLGLILLNFYLDTRRRYSLT